MIRGCKHEYKAIVQDFSYVLSVLFVLFPLQKAFAEVMDHTKYEMNWSYSKSKKKPIRTELIKTADGKIAFA